MLVLFRWKSSSFWDSLTAPMRMCTLFAFYRVRVLIQAMRLLQNITVSFSLPGTSPENYAKNWTCTNHRFIYICYLPMKRCWIFIEHNFLEMFVDNLRFRWTIFRAKKNQHLRANKLRAFYKWVCTVADLIHSMSMWTESAKVLMVTIRTGSWQ